MSLPIEQMLKDAGIVERTLGEDMAVSPIADLCYHVKALAAEVKALQKRNKELEETIETMRNDSWERGTYD